MGDAPVVSDEKLMSDMISAVDNIWLCFLGATVFYMQAGFAMLEVGSIRVKNTKGLLVKTALDNCIMMMMWFICGWAFSFGRDPHQHTYQPFIGKHGFALVGQKEYSLFFYQWAFASTSATIVSGAIAERAQNTGYLIQVVVMGTVNYPLIAHWAWGGGWLSTFAENGYLDFAGSGVVHLTGGISGLIGAIVVGPRVGRFDAKGVPQKLPGYSTTLITLGCFILWFGWIGFNIGSTITIYGKVHIAGRAAVTTLLCGATGCLVCLFSSIIFKKEWDVPWTLNGLLSGMVASTAPCAYVPIWSGVIIGSSAGLWYTLWSWIFLKLRVDDPVDAAPVHAASGLLGVVMTGLFADKGYIEEVLGHTTHNYGLILGGGWQQIGVQLIGAVTIIGWSGTISLGVFAALRFAKLLRVPEVHGHFEGDKTYEDAWARITMMDCGRIEEFQFKLTRGKGIGTTDTVSSTSPVARS